MSRYHEAWANGARWRLITIYDGSARVDIQYGWGKYDQDVSHFVRMFGGSVAMAMESAHGSGTDNWYRNLTHDGAKAKLAAIRANAEKAGFAKLGDWRAR